MTKVGVGEERRATARFDTKIDGALASSRGVKRSIQITDLSTGGFNMDLGHRTISDKAGYAVRFAGLETLGAELRWSSGREAGFRFDRPLHPAVLDHIVRENPAANDQTDAPADHGAAVAPGRR